MTVWIVKDLGRLMGVYTSKRVAMSNNSWSEEGVEEVDVSDELCMDDLPKEEALTCTREEKIQWINFKCLQLGVHPHDIWLGGGHEEQIGLWDAGTISEEELNRVISEGDWEVN